MLVMRPVSFSLSHSLSLSSLVLSPIITRMQASVPHIQFTLLTVDVFFCVSFAVLSVAFYFLLLLQLQGSVMFTHSLKVTVTERAVEKERERKDASCHLIKKHTQTPDRNLHGLLRAPLSALAIPMFAWVFLVASILHPPSSILLFST